VFAEAGGGGVGRDATTDGSLAIVLGLLDPLHPENDSAAIRITSAPKLKPLDLPGVIVIADFPT